MLEIASPKTHAAPVEVQGAILLGYETFLEVHLPVRATQEDLTLHVSFFTLEGPAYSVPSFLIVPETWVPGESGC